MARHAAVKHIMDDFSFPNSSAFAKLLDFSAHSKSSLDTRRVHACILKTSFSREVFIQNRLIDVYGRCGCLEDARKVFVKMSEKNIFTWNSIISALTKCGFLDEAAEMFDSMSERDECSWNTMISGFSQHERFEEALEYFIQMHREGFVLSDYSFSSSLSACSGLMDMRMGIQIHASISKSRYVSDVYMGALVDMYSKCGNVEAARKVFDAMSDPNIVSWNTLITCYEQNGPVSEALGVFMRMMNSGHEPDEVTLSSLVSACAGLAAIEEGLQIHTRVLKFDKLRDDLVLGNALVDMYAKCGRIREARWVFDSMPIRNVVSETTMVNGYVKAESIKTAKSLFVNMMNHRNVVSWNALIAGYTQNGENEEALGLFLLLKRESVWPTHYTFGNLLNACANLADLQLGKQAHTHITKHGFRFQSGPEDDIFVGNSLIDMYVKCGSIEDGCRVFEKMVERDRVSWNALIVGYAQNGYGTEALEFFRRMLVSGEKPDHVTMIGVLCACSHAGLVNEGRHYFKSMIDQYDLVPLKDHYTCMVDLYGRAGRLHEAKDLIEEMEIPPDAVVWGSLLAACKAHGDVSLGKYVAEKVLEIDPTNSGPYILLSNMYAELGKWKNVGRVRKLMRQRRVVKQPGCSWIEIQNRVHVFMVKDKRHPQKEEIYIVLNELLKQMKKVGYIPDTTGLEVDDEFSVDMQTDAAVT